MPKIVDHDGRRQELARAALRVIGRDGLEAATTRAVADEAGWSTGVLKHYFTDKDQLLREALRELERLNLERFQRATQCDSGFESIAAAVTAILNADHAESRVWVAFMHRAASGGATASAMRRAIDAWVTRWQQLVEQGQLDGSIVPHLDAHRAAVEIHAYVNGLRLSSMFAAGQNKARPAATGHRLELFDAIATRPAHH